MLEKLENEAFRNVVPVQGEFLSNFILLDRPVINLTIPNKFISYEQFKMEGLHCHFFCLCFVLGLAPRIFSKLLRVPIALLTRIDSRIIIEGIAKTSSRVATN